MGGFKSPFPQTLHLVATRQNSNWSAPMLFPRPYGSMSSSMRCSLMLRRLVSRMCPRNQAGNTTSFNCAIDRALRF